MGRARTKRNPQQQPETFLPETLTVKPRLAWLAQAESRGLLLQHSNCESPKIFLYNGVVARAYYESRGLKCLCSIRGYRENPV